MAEDDVGVGAALMGGIFYLLYAAVILAVGWWSIRVTIWFFTGGDFPLPWQPFS